MWNHLNIIRGYNYLPHNVKKDAITTLKDYVTEKKGIFLHPTNEDTDEVLKFDNKGILKLVKINPEEVGGDDLAAESNAADEGGAEGQATTDPAAKGEDQDDFSYKTHNLIVGTYLLSTFLLTTELHLNTILWSPGTFRKAVELGKHTFTRMNHKEKANIFHVCLLALLEIHRNPKGKLIF